MPKARQTTGNQKLLQQNLAKIKRARASRNKKLVMLIDSMEQHYIAALGNDGYRALLSKTSLEAILKRFMQTPEGRRVTMSAGATPEEMVAGAQGNPAQAMGVPQEASMPLVTDEDEEEYYEQYSTDVEQSLLDERDRASAVRRAEIDEELAAIQRSRDEHMANDLPFDEFTAEEALETFRLSKNTAGSRDDEDLAPGTMVPEEPEDPEDAESDDDSDQADSEQDSGAENSQDETASDGDADPFNPTSMKGAASAPAKSPNDSATGVSQGGTPATSETETTSTHQSAFAGNVAASGAPTERTDAPSLGGGNELLTGASDSEDDSDRGALSDENEDSRGALSRQGGSLEDDPAAQAQKDAQKKKDKMKKRVIMHLVLHTLAMLAPFFAILVAVVLLASCIENAMPWHWFDGDSTESTQSTGTSTGASSTNPTASGAGGGTNTVTRRSTTSTLPRVEVDRQGLSEMFAEDEEESTDSEKDEEGQSDGELSDEQKRVIEACKTTPSPGAGLCAQWVGDVFANANVGVTFRGDARDWWHAFCDPNKAPASCEAGTVKTDPNRSKLKPAMIIAVASSSSGSELGAIYGHIGIYIGNNQVMHNIGSIATCSVDEWINTYGQYADVGWGWADGIKLGGAEGGGDVGDGLGIKISSQKDIKKWAKLIDAFLEGRPLAGQGQKFAEAAAKYGIDPRLSPSMSVIESGGGQVLCAPYNAWGVTANGTPGIWASYSSWEDAIDHHAKLVSGPPYHIPFTREDAATYCDESYWDGDPNFCLKTFAEKCGRGERV